MSTYSNELAQLQAHARASQMVYGWIEGAQALALLSAAVEYGFIEVLGHPASQEEITALPAARCENLFIRRFVSTNY